MSLELEKHLVARANEAFEPLTANFELTPLCNLHCDMCFVRLTRQQVDERGGLHDANSWLDIARQLQQMGTLFILLTGGEPMLHPEFHRIYTTLRSMGFIITLNTNGTMITEEMCRDTFREKPRRVNVTLYGSSADTYGRLCHNRKGYERTVSALRLLRKYDIDTKLNLSMVRENSNDYDDIMALAHELGIPVVSNSICSPCSAPSADEPPMWWSQDCPHKRLPDSKTYTSAISKGPNTPTTPNKPFSRPSTARPLPKAPR